MRRVWSPSMT
ncbi:hypothetical protein EYF80_065538 [Liparis tanakae]|uniref:Uncharacterized protein n=1 Tax=Liparis tanakae TaxID=230148 RepID=A0A4Z2E6C5_9TELE|nr:hypothetical protein EYF80_065538 [Liparis tanakae]